MVNKVILIGRLGKDPELRSTQSGKQVCKFSLATDSGFGDQRKTEWHNVVTFGRQAENCAKYLHKGSVAYIEGNIQYCKSEIDKGKTRYWTVIIANTVQFLSTHSDQFHFR
jgi:single-strand DNA-binding protein